MDAEEKDDGITVRYHEEIPGMEILVVQVDLRKLEKSKPSPEYFVVEKAFNPRKITKTKGKPL